ncbi:MAG TPA: hypothetical protein PLL01_03935 [Rhodoferax sp.]|nr:hypothetical protein [Rhodoferax sp.]
MKTPATDPTKTTAKPIVLASNQPSMEAMEIAAKMLANRVMREAKKT